MEETRRERERETRAFRLLIMIGSLTMAFLILVVGFQMLWYDGCKGETSVAKLDRDLEGLDLGIKRLSKVLRPHECSKQVIKALEEHREKIDEVTYDLVLTLAKDMTLFDQRLRLLKPIFEQEGYYIKDKKTVTKRLKEFQRCDITKNPRVGVCSMQHSNGPFIQEFISHYLLLGCSKVILYDNSEPDTPEWKYFRMVVKPFVEAGFVEVVDWYFTEGDTFRAVEAFNECVNDNRFRFDWIAVVDTDEFVVLHEPHNPCLNQELKKFNKFGAVVVPWRLLSPRGVSSRDPSKPLFDQYRYYINNPGGAIKSIVQTKFFQQMAQQHEAKFYEGHAVDFGGTQVEGAGWVVPPEQRFSHAELRHYYSPDWKYFLYEKMCSVTQGAVSLGSYFAPRMRRFVKCLTTNTTYETSTRHTQLLKDFLFES
jgi:hypothetical protein